MKKVKILLIALLIANSFWSCEKDDLCADGTPTTPGLIVEFYNIDNRAELKAVSNFAFYVPGMTDTIQPQESVSRIEVPLKTNAFSTQWAFRLTLPEAGGTIENTDLITFNYTTRDEYVSRACGYKTLFTLNASTNEVPNPLLENSALDETLWIQEISVEQPNINDENEVHVKIYF